MKILSQRDTRWADKRLGASKLTVGRWGCTTTCISMASDYFGCYRSPLELASNAHNFTRDGLVLWWNFKFDKMKFKERLHGNTETLMRKAKEVLKDPEKVMLLQVNSGAHWVLAYSTKMFSRDLGIADPWYGKVVPCLKTYHNITGGAIFERKESIEKVEEIKPSEPVKPTKTLIKAKDSAEIYYYNGKKKFLIPNWVTFATLFAPIGGMKAVEETSAELINEIPSGKAFTSIK